MKLELTDADLREEAKKGREFGKNTNPPRFEDFNDAARAAIKLVRQANYWNGWARYNFTIFPPREIPDSPDEPTRPLSAEVVRLIKEKFREAGLHAGCEPPVSEQTLAHPFYDE